MNNSVELDDVTEPNTHPVEITSDTKSLSSGLYEQMCALIDQFATWEEATTLFNFDFVTEAKSSSKEIRDQISKHPQTVPSRITFLRKCLRRHRSIHVGVENHSLARREDNEFLRAFALIFRMKEHELEVETEEFFCFIHHIVGLVEAVAQNNQLFSRRCVDLVAKTKFAQKKYAQTLKRSNGTCEKLEALTKKAEQFSTYQREKAVYASAMAAQAGALLSILSRTAAQCRKKKNDCKGSEDLIKLGPEN